MTRFLSHNGSRLVKIMSPRTLTHFNPLKCPTMLSPSEKPTILLIPGSWQPSQAMDGLRNHLTSFSFPVHLYSYPSTRGSPPLKWLPDDTATLRSILDSLIEE